MHTLAPLAHGFLHEQWYWKDVTAVQGPYVALNRQLALSQKWKSDNKLRSHGSTCTLESMYVWHTEPPSET